MTSESNYQTTEIAPEGKKNFCRVPTYTYRQKIRIKHEGIALVDERILPLNPIRKYQRISLADDVLPIDKLTSLEEKGSLLMVYKENSRKQR